MASHCVRVVVSMGLLGCVTTGLVPLACSSTKDDGATGTGGAGTGGVGTGGASNGGANPNTEASGTGGSTATTSDACPTTEEEAFSFFLASQAALQDDSGQVDGYGGDLGGIEGADAICQRIAEVYSPCQKNKVWHAFLSTPTVNARTRIGKGPWYDRVGRLVAENLENLLTDRPTGADPAIVDDLPNEQGVPNHAPDGKTQVDNHEILTGSGTDGNVYTQTNTGGMAWGNTACGDATWTVEAATCWGWTTKEGKGCPRVGHSWPRQGSGTNWISVWNEGGCAPGGTLSDTGGLDGTRRVGSAGGYGGFYCIAVRNP